MQQKMRLTVRRISPTFFAKAGERKRGRGCYCLVPSAGNRLLFRASHKARHNRRDLRARGVARRGEPAVDAVDQAHADRPAHRVERVVRHVARIGELIEARGLAHVVARPLRVAVEDRRHVLTGDAVLRAEAAAVAVHDAAFIRPADGGVEPIARAHVAERRAVARFRAASEVVKHLREHRAGHGAIRRKAVAARAVEDLARGDERDVLAVPIRSAHVVERLGVVHNDDLARACDRDDDAALVALRNARQIAVRVLFLCHDAGAAVRHLNFDLRHFRHGNDAVAVLIVQHGGHIDLHAARAVLHGFGNRCDRQRGLRGAALVAGGLRLLLADGGLLREDAAVFVLDDGAGGAVRRLVLRRDGLFHRFVAVRVRGGRGRGGLGGRHAVFIGLGGDLRLGDGGGEHVALLVLDRRGRGGRTRRRAVLRGGHVGLGLGGRFGKGLGQHPAAFRLDLLRDLDRLRRFGLFGLAAVGVVLRGDGVAVLLLGLGLGDGLVAAGVRRGLRDRLRVTDPGGVRHGAVRVLLAAGGLGVDRFRLGLNSGAVRVLGLDRFRRLVRHGHGAVAVRFGGGGGVQLRRHGCAVRRSRGLRGLCLGGRARRARRGRGGVPVAAVIPLAGGRRGRRGGGGRGRGRRADRHRDARRHAVAVVFVAHDLVPNIVGSGVGF